LIEVLSKLQRRRKDPKGGPMSRRLMAFGLVFMLSLGVSMSLKAADKPDTQTAASWLEGQEDVYQPTVLKQEVKLVRKFEVGDQNGFYLNVMQDCWPTDIEEWYTDPEMENYILSPDNVVLVWKHKIFEGCSNYMATLVGLPCEDGKPRIIGRLAWMVTNLQYGYVEPGGEYKFMVWLSGMPEGHWDWFVVTECNDTNGMITPPLKDGDIDDVIGANLGTVTYMPLVYGPEPVELLDPDPGGFPPGRLPGEEGATRCWCFMVEAAPECPSLVGDWIVNYDWNCDGSYNSHDMFFYNDGTWYSSEGYTGTWAQDGCNIDWWYTSGTHYWGVMTLDGMYMDGEMETSGGSMWGCWWADRVGSNAPSAGGNESFTSSGEELPGK
jgi:hypothetical protein